MNGAIREVMAECISKLQHSSFEVVAEDYSPESFGNSFVELRSPNLCLRIVRERGQVYFETAPISDPADWHDAETMLQFLGVDLACDSCCDLILANLPQVADVLNGPRKRELVALEQHIAKERFS